MNEVAGKTALQDQESEGAWRLAPTREQIFYREFEGRRRKRELVKIIGASRPLAALTSGTANPAVAIAGQQCCVTRMSN